MLRLICLFFLILFSGCASLPQFAPVSDGERQEVVDRFTSFGRQSCPAQIDADVTLSFDSLLFKGAISGYLQAMQPSYLRFEAVNPFGLTESVLATDGSSFTFLAVRDQKGYQGALDAQKVREYVAPEVAAALDYYWLTGRLFAPETAVYLGRDQEGGGHWFAVHSAQERGEERVLFDAAAGIIVRRLVFSVAGELALDVTYEYGPGAETTAGAACRQPSALAIKSRGNGGLKLDFQQSYPARSYESRQFTLSIPPEFERISVQ